MRSVVRGAWAVLLKDFRSEFRTRYALSAIALFALTSIAALSFVLRGQAMQPEESAGLSWIIVFFAAVTGLARPFVQEAESGTELLLRQAATSEAVWLGKFLFSLVLMLGLEAIIFPVYSALMNAPVVRVWYLALVAALGAVCLSAATTLIAALVCKARARATVFAVAALPVMLPALVFLVQASGSAFGAGDAGGESASALRLVVSYSGILIVLSWLLFPLVWEE
ncbi:MAG: heme exporter protein CcmB [Armatimonadetes bacterium]|nr:heme exporter protein CcmB [Armatimonadota bacterium]